MTKNEINYPIGSKVIVRDNENEPYKIGTIIEWHLAINHYYPLVKMEDDQKEYMVMGLIRHYSKTLTNILDKLTPREQWNVMCEFAVIEEDEERFVI